MSEDELIQKQIEEGKTIENEAKPGEELIAEPGSSIEFEVELIKPLAIEENKKFVIREGDHTIGQGTVLKTLE